MTEQIYIPHVVCGRVFQPVLPDNLDASEPPIILAEVGVNTAHTPMPCVLVKFSEFINFTLLGVNPKIKILYRLVRKDKYSKYGQILQEWEFGFESSQMFEITNVDTNQPTVLNFCDCLDKHVHGRIDYRLEIVQIETNSVKSYGFTNKSITATVISGVHECSQRP